VTQSTCEWDWASLPNSALAGVRSVDDDLLAVLRDFRSLCVAVWCLLEPDRVSEVREAVEFHLARLRRRDVMGQKA
jgi:hypothetical protein